MKVSCPKCPAKYAIPTEKVAGRRIRIHCKKCGSPIYIDGTTSPPTASDSPPPTGVRRDTGSDPSSLPEAAADPGRSGSTPEHGERLPTLLADASGPQPGASEPEPEPLQSAGATRTHDSQENRAQNSPASTSGPSTTLASTSVDHSGTLAAPDQKPTVSPLSSSRPLVRPPGAMAPSWVPKPAKNAPRPAKPSTVSSSLSTSPPSAAVAAAPRRGPVAPPKKPVPPANVTIPRRAAVVAPPKADATTRGKSQFRQTLLGGFEPAVGSAPGSAPTPTSQAASAPPLVWLVALSEDLQEEKTTEQVIALYVQKVIDAETVVWREGMDQWQGLFDVPVLVQAFAARGIHPPPPEHSYPGSGIRDVSAPPSIPPSSAPAAGLSSDPPPSAPPLTLWRQDTQAHGDAIASPCAAEDDDDAENLDLDDDATVALERDVARELLPEDDEAFDFGPSEEELPTRLVPSESVNPQEQRFAPLPAAGRPALPSAAGRPAVPPAAAPTFPPPPPSSRGVAPPAAVPLASPALHLIGTPENRRNPAVWVVLFAALVTVVVLIAVASRIL